MSRGRKEHHNRSETNDESASNAPRTQFQLDLGGSSGLKDDPVTTLSRDLSALGWDNLRGYERSIQTLEYLLRKDDQTAIRVAHWVSRRRQLECGDQVSTGRFRSTVALVDICTLLTDEEVNDQVIMYLLDEVVKQHHDATLIEPLLVRQYQDTTDEGVKQTVLRCINKRFTKSKVCFHIWFEMFFGIGSLLCALGASIHTCLG